jgi:hypothetical protein
MSDQWCPWCGVDNPAEANFCWKCAGPQRDYADRPESEWEWEACQVVIDHDSVGHEGFEDAPRYLLHGSIPYVSLMRHWRVVARAVGPSGRTERICASTPTFEGDANLSRAEFDQANTELEQQLIQDGWERVGQFSTFQRRVTRRSVRTG